MFLAIASSTFSVPAKIPVQGRLTNASTGAAFSGIYNFTFRVYNASTGGTMLWEENQSLLLDSGGLWSSFLGNNTALSLNFSEDTYIEIEINHDGNPLPRVQLATVPYSKRTDIAANLSCIDCIGGAEINESNLSGVNAAQLGGQSSGYYLNTSTPYSYWTNQTLSSRNNITDLNVSVGFQFTSANSNQLQGQASGYYLNNSTPFGGDIYGSYNSIKVNASKIDA